MNVFWFFFAKRNALLFEKRSKNFHSFRGVTGAVRRSGESGRAE
jgi:hypothetical protein